MGLIPLHPMPIEIRFSVRFLHQSNLIHSPYIFRPVLPFKLRFCPTWLFLNTPRHLPCRRFCPGNCQVLWRHSSSPGGGVTCLNLSPQTRRPVRGPRSLTIKLTVHTQASGPGTPPMGLSSPVTPSTSGSSEKSEPDTAPVPKVLRSPLSASPLTCPGFPFKAGT